ncbi:MAG TPA: ribose-phosphate pyrophosphokinase-like domain-containing protein, partial [Candidatus Hydrogenedentes bacterium]|nr:ribose-phosphate pyrophosphokinase-like domain-containing protein [Candidatus Hydrogenedentota bacterium]
MLRAEAISLGGVLQIKFNNTTSIFPGGEVHVAVDDSFVCHFPQMIRITAHLRSPADQMALFMLTDAIRRVCRAPICLRMPYVPYARQDRVCNPGEALAAKVFCQMINAQDYETVTIFDPHSDVVPALLDRVVVKDAAEAIDLILGRSEFADGVTFIAPDAGAQKRVLKLAKRFGVDSVVCADKVRDT